MRAFYDKLIERPELYFYQPSIPLAHPLQTPTSPLQHTVDFDDSDIALSEVMEGEKESAPICEERDKLKALFDEWIPSRAIKYGVAHTTETFENATVTGIVRYWREQAGWGSVPGYHLLFTRDGGFTFLQDFNKITYGVRGFNGLSLHLAWMGGLVRRNNQNIQIDNRTPKQKELMNYAFELLKVKCPSVQILGHKDFPNQTKACPLFDATAEYVHLNSQML